MWWKRQRNGELIRERSRWQVRSLSLCSMYSVLHPKLFRWQIAPCPRNSLVRTSIDLQLPLHSHLIHTFAIIIHPLHTLIHLFSGTPVSFPCLSVSLSVCPSDCLSLHACWNRLFSPRGENMVTISPTPSHPLRYFHPFPIKALYDRQITHISGVLFHPISSSMGVIISCQNISTLTH